MIYPFQSIRGIAADNFSEVMETQTIKRDKVIIMLCSQGSMDIEINNSPIKITEHDVLFCMPEVIIGNYATDKDFECQIIVTPSEVLHDTLYPALRQERYWYNKLSYLIEHPLIHLNEEQYELSKAYEKIFRIYGRTAIPPYQEQMSDLVARGMILVVLSWVEHQMQSTQNDQLLKHIALTSKQDIHFQGFMQLLQEQKGCKRDVAWYADALNITPKYLAFISKKCCDKSPLQLINEIAIREIKQLLLNSNLSIKQIAFDLNFPNASMFCKYFRLHTGTSPLDFREKNRR